MKKITSFLFICAVIFNHSVTAQNNRFISDKYYQKFGDYAMSVNYGLSFFYSKLDKVYLQETYKGHEAYMDSPDFGFGFQYYLKKNYYLNFRLSSGRIMSYGMGTWDYTNQVVGFSSNAQYFNFVFSTSRYFPLSNRLFLKGEAGINLLRSSAFTHSGDVLYANMAFLTTTHRKYFIGPMVGIGLDFHIFRRYALTLNHDFAYLLNSPKLMTTEFLHQNATYEIKGFQMSTLPIYHSVTLGLKIGLEHSSFYKKKR